MSAPRAATRRPPPPAWQGWLAAAGAVAGALLSPAATARRVARQAAFDSAGPTGQHRLGPGRRAEAATTFPRDLRVAWTARVDAGVAHAPAVDGAGRVVVAGLGSVLVQLGPTGKREWSLALDAGIEAAPVLLAGGARGVALADATWLRVSAAGAVLGRSPLRVVGALAPPLVRRHGGVVLGAGDAVVELDADGALVRRATIGDRVRALVEDRGRVLLVGASGRVWRWPEAATPREAGSFGLGVDEAVLCGDGRLCAAATPGAIHELDTRTGEVRRRVNDPSLGPFATPAVARSGSTVILTSDGLLVAHDPEGNERHRAAVGAREPGRSAGGLGPILDAGGTAAFVWPRAPVGVARSNGEVRVAESSACDDPVGLAPAPDGGLVLACRAGHVVRLAAGSE